MPSYSLKLGILLLAFAASLCGQEPVPAQPANPPAAGSAQPVVSQPKVAAPVAASATSFGEITGAVKSGNIALPGVSVTAANTLTGKKYSTSTDVDGSFKIAVSGRGR